MMNKKSTQIIAVLLAVILVSAGLLVLFVKDGNGKGDGEETKTLTDMRGNDVKMPKDPKRVAIIDRGFIAQIVVALGVEDKIIATGGLLGANIPPSTNTRDTLLLNPEYIGMPNFGYPGYLPFGIEVLAASNPDLVIWKQTITGASSPDSNAILNALNNVLKIPLFVLLEPGYEGTPTTLEPTYASIYLIGKIFNKEEKATEINDFLKNKIKEITNKTTGIPDSEKPSMMILGLANNGAGAYAYGPNYTHGLYTEEIAAVKNVVRTHTNQIMSIEEILNKDPELIVLVDGPINPNLDTIYNDSNFRIWGNLSALENNNVCSVGQLAWWGEHMLNFPSILMIIAKQAHPSLFADVDLRSWIEEFEMELYGVNLEKAEALMFAEKLFWNHIIPGP